MRRIECLTLTSTLAVFDVNYSQTTGATGKAYITMRASKLPSIISKQNKEMKRTVCLGIGMQTRTVFTLS